MRNIIAYLDKRQHNAWETIGVAVSASGLSNMKDSGLPMGITIIITGFIITVIIGGRRGN